MKQRRAAIAGVYQSRQGDLSEEHQPMLWFEAATRACADAGMTLADVDGVVGPAPTGVGIRDKLPGSALGYDLLGKPLRFHALNTMGAGSGAGAVNLAAYAVSAGLAEAVLVVTAAAGDAEGYAGADRDSVVRSLAKLSGPYEYIYGTTRVADYAVLAMRHFHEFGTTSSQLAEVAVVQREAAILHPLSVHGHRGPLTVDDVLASRMIADPLHLLDCCAINQGAGAYVVTTLERARDTDHTPIELLGYGEGHNHLDPNSAPSLAVFEGARIAADTAFDLADVGREDIGVVGIGDHFTINVLLGLESAGFCDIGESGPFVESGALRLDGRLPTNTSGGFL
ncbi:MAG: thiolase family protein, partial [Microbacterium sp.]